ncbi:hypothetical protein [Streptomyces sp. NK08204]|uniref:hypothetical protein n=1 Tax=Streptomyces sp. NK08204 TaxID=2873260 RepID=UPI001CEDF87F|nr:hypothetical protein [Streptomyces sp. NK08204]
MFVRTTAGIGVRARPDRPGPLRDRVREALQRLNAEGCYRTPGAGLRGGTTWSELRQSVDTITGRRSAARRPPDARRTERTERTRHACHACHACHESAKT